VLCATASRSASHGGPPAKLDTERLEAGLCAVPPFATTAPASAEGGQAKSGVLRRQLHLIVEVLGGIFTHKVSVSSSRARWELPAWPANAAETKGWLPKFGLASAISLNLGILNLMPFPILDGGLILLLLIESVMRRDIGINVKERIYQAAFVVLVAFFASSSSTT
jgi:regulator of sigma E protease